MCLSCSISTYWKQPFFFFFNDTATTEIYTLSLHDALPIWSWRMIDALMYGMMPSAKIVSRDSAPPEKISKKPRSRSEEHTSELQSQSNLVCRLLLEKKKKKQNNVLSLHTNTSS